MTTENQTIDQIADRPDGLPAGFFPAGFPAPANPPTPQSMAWFKRWVKETLENAPGCVVWDIRTRLIETVQWIDPVVAEAMRELVAAELALMVVLNAKQTTMDAEDAEDGNGMEAQT